MIVKLSDGANVFTKVRWKYFYECFDGMDGIGKIVKVGKFLKGGGMSTVRLFISKWRVFKLERRRWNAAMQSVIGEF